ncbi:acetyl-CoA carboxylase carboxyl transferase subunit alpha [Butyrivibrio sp. M55]|uniref:acetyl-CoA carboxylase carboxyl transferase subunit alpha n=1 Tax=Butyrivibrio sp. M55 TaxID=1855323 RepID=UPI0008EB1A65|nr:acetyl-CoA carboxylase carboxyl transferase subunit alpha [Butyrivibrio sp. M55]SFU45579.1 acetyl-CoA carboxylase carboxyltransferase subunit alpha [Butyrivibrio sp. M55]
MSERTCSCCKSQISRSMLDNNYSICPNCGNYLRFHARKRIASLADPGTFREWEAGLLGRNPLNDPGYAKKLEETSQKHNLKDAIITGVMKIQEEKVAIGVMDTRFMMASMGQVVGEKVTLLFEEARKKKLPVLLFCCSGGARMQEGIVSLMQMEKTAAAVKRHSEAGLLYISVLTNPTMGGVTASYAMSADIILAEKGAMIGFAGRRVIEQNIGEKLPPDFQTAEFQLSKGFVDGVVTRPEMRDLLGKILHMHSRKKVKLKANHIINWEDYVADKNQKSSPWERVRIARAHERPTTLDYVKRMFDNFIEFHGDRSYEDDHAIVGGIATLDGYPVTVIGQQKGKKDLNEAVYRNWGMASQSGYRKAYRLMKQAEKFNRPIICFVDTIGAACGRDAEERGQGAVIAELLRDVSSIQVPILSIIIGEGGSGGALALAVGNEVWMLENSVYSVLTPEGYASILWKDNSKAAEAAEIMKMTSDDLYELGIIEKVISEPENLSKENMKEMCNHIKDEMVMFLVKYGKKNGKSITNDRYMRFRRY